MAGEGPSSVLTRLRHFRGSLPPTARRIADYVERHAGDVIRMSITELAEQTQASEGSVVGFCRRLGTSGFQDLKILLAADLVEPLQFIQEDLTESDDFETVRDRVFAAHVVSLTETKSLLSAEALSRAVSMIVSARRIEAYGIGSSGPVAQDLAYRLLQLGYDSKAVIDSHVQAVSATMAGRRSP